ncbi:MAG: DUF1553 domain-containing protein [Planctomycetota bacterium]|nr:MAG: DUF1553 domain-containing protein [Planctomycetota bacterium]
MSTDFRFEIFPLLEALCEHSLTPAGRDRLEQLVIESPEARQLYVRYMQLHGTLTWDAALTDASQLVAFAERAGTQATTRPVRLRRWLVTSLGGLLAGALALLMVLWIGRTPELPSDPVISPNLANHPVLSAPNQNTDTTPLPTVALDVPMSSPTPSVMHPPNPAPAAVVAATVPMDDASVVSRINHLMRAKWSDAHVEPSLMAEDSEWLRRVYLDLLGHIPDSESVDRFLADGRRNKRSLLVQELMNHPDHARNLATIWSNLLVGRTTERPIDRAGLSKFLREQFRQNRPWTETVARLVSAEGDAREVGEANFLLAHLNNQAVPATAVTARIFLCRQVQCTQCHKHPDSSHGGTMSEFWELNSFFQQAEVVENRKYNPLTGRDEIVSRSLIDKPEGGPTHYEDLRGVMNVAYPRFAGQEINPDSTIKRRQELARLITTEGQRELAAALVNRTWAHFFGQGLVNPIDDMGPHSPCAHPELMEALTEAVVASNFDLVRLQKWIVSSQAYHLSSVATAQNASDEPVDGALPLFSRMYLKPLSAEQLFDSLLVATAADRAGASYWEQAEANRQAWLADFYSALENEENADATTFGGTYAQTLMMMNGDLVQRAISNAPGTVLNEIARTNADERTKIRSLSRAALGRDPRNQELVVFQSQLKHRREMPGAEPLGDVFWAYLNSTEFTVNH